MVKVTDQSLCLLVVKIHSKNTFFAMHACYKARQWHVRLKSTPEFETVTATDIFHLSDQSQCPSLSPCIA